MRLDCVILLAVLMFAAFVSAFPSLPLLSVPLTKRVGYSYPLGPYFSSSYFKPLYGFGFGKPHFGPSFFSRGFSPYYRPFFGSYFNSWFSWPRFNSWPYFSSPYFSSFGWPFGKGFGYGGYGGYPSGYSTPYSSSTVESSAEPAVSSSVPFHKILGFNYGGVKVAGFKIGKPFGFGSSSSSLSLPTIRLGGSSYLSVAKGHGPGALITGGGENSLFSKLSWPTITIPSKSSFLSSI